MATEHMSPARARDILRLADTFQARRPSAADEAAALARRLRISRSRAATLIRLARAALAAETPRLRKRRYRCRYCGSELRAWLPAFQEPNGALLLGHLGNSHPAEAGAYLARMRTTGDITPMVLEAYEAVEVEEA